MNQNFNLRLEADQEQIAREVPSQRVLEIHLEAPRAIQLQGRAPLNLALVLDRSGSMSGSKLQYVKQAAMHVLERLQDQDSAALVVYDEEVSVLSPAVRMTAEQRANLRGMAAHIDEGGSTNLGGGWLEGCRQAAGAASPESINRVLLLTDGLANTGITDPEELARHARELAHRGVSTSTFGVGEGFNEHLLEAMSSQGRGNFYFIETPNQIPDLFLREFSELSAVTGRDVQLMLDTPAHVDVQVAGGWAVERTPQGLRISLGSLYSEQALDIYLRLLTPPAEQAAGLHFQARLAGMDEEGQPFEARTELDLAYVPADSLKNAPLNHALLKRYAAVDLAENATEALKLERRGENERARRLMQQSIEGNRIFMDSAQLMQYETLSERLRRGLDETGRKQEHYSSYNIRRQRGR